MKSNNPLVTVYIPTHNRLELLKRAIESVLTQSYNNIELIIVDDASTDNTEDYLKQLTLKDTRVKYFKNLTSQGACYSRNIAIHNANGEFITGLDDDDFFLNDRISNFTSYWKNKKINSIALYSAQYIKNKDGKLQIIKKPKIVSKKQLFISNFVGNQIFTKTEYIRNIGGFDENLPAWQDLDCWLSILNKQTAERTNSIDYVIDISHAHERISKKIENIELAYNIICNKHSSNKKDKNRLYIQLLSYKEQAELKKEIFKSLNILDIKSVITITKMIISKWHLKNHIANKIKCLKI